MLAVSKEISSRRKKRSRWQKKNNLKRPPNENSSRKCRPLRSLVPSGSDFNIPGIDDDKIVFSHDPNRYVSDDDIPDEDNYFSIVEEKIDRELTSRRKKKNRIIIDGRVISVY